ncbi:MAG: hypothetical protein AAF804_18955, partial [Bacteroidota bacterium]
MRLPIYLISALVILWVSCNSKEPSSGSGPVDQAIYNGASQDSIEVQAYLEEHQSLYDAAEYASAVALCRKAYQVAQGSSPGTELTLEVALKLARSLSRIKEFAAALDTVKLAHRLASELPIEGEKKQ